MVAGAGHAIRNAGWLMAQRGAHVLGAALFAVMVPRLMGPSVFGRYALLLSVSMWFALLSGLGAVSMMTRSVPRFMAEGDAHGLRRLTSSLVLLRAGTGACSAAVYVLLAIFVLREPDLLAPLFVAGSIFFRTTGNLSYALLLGLNQAARWGFGDLMRRWLVLALVPIGFVVAGLRGACLGLLAAEFSVLVCGLWWTRHYLHWSAVDLSRRHLAPYLRTSTLFAAGAVLLALTQRSGETLVRLSTGSYEEVAFFGAAYAIYLTVAHALWQFAIAFAPFLLAQMEQGHRSDVAEWLERLLKLMIVAGVLAAAAMVFAGPHLIPWLLGSRYRAVAVNAVPLTLVLLPAALGCVSRLLALTLNRPGITTTGAAMEMAAFWVLGVLLATRVGSLGASWAALPAAALYATCSTWRTRREFTYSLAPAGRAVVLASVFVPLALLRGSLPVSAGLLAAGAAVYGVLLLKSRVITIAEIAHLWGQLRGTGPAAFAGEQG